MDAPKAAVTPAESTFEIDRNGWVRVNLSSGGYLYTQSVEAHLLFAILRQLEQKD